jgi:hypothetical protein
VVRTYASPGKGERGQDGLAGPGDILGLVHMEWCEGIGPPFSALLGPELCAVITADYDGAAVHRAGDGRCLNLV